MPKRRRPSDNPDVRRDPVTFLVYDAFTGDGVARTTANLANQLSATRQVRMVSLYRSRDRPRFDLTDDVELTVLCDRSRPRSADRHAAPRATQSPQPEPVATHHVRAHRPGAQPGHPGRSQGVVVSTRPSLHLALTTWAPPAPAARGLGPPQLPGSLRQAAGAGGSARALPQLDAYVVLTDADAADYRREFGEVRPCITVIRNALSWP